MDLLQAGQDGKRNATEERPKSQLSSVKAHRFGAAQKGTSQQGVYLKQSAERRQ
jgi:hypothetical protein